MLQSLFQKVRLKIIIGVMTYKNGFDTSILKGINILSADKGGCRAVFKVNENNCNEQGQLSNGFATTILDSLTSFGLSTVLYTTLHVTFTIHMRYFQPIKMGDEIIIDTKVLNLDKNLVFLEANFQNNKTGELVAKGSHGKFILQKSIV